MQILTYHFSKKKSDFHYFFNSITQLIQKLSKDIMLQIDKEFLQACQEFKGLLPQEIEDACMRMQNERMQIYDKMIDRLCVSLKNYAFQLNQKSQFKSQLPSNKSIPQKDNPQSKVSQFYVENIESVKTISPNQFKRYDSSSSSQSLTQKNNQEQVHTPIQNREQQKYFSVRIPSPFAQKYKSIRQQSSQKKVGEYKEIKQRSKSKQKLQVLKKNDICQSLDNYLNKEAKQMLYKSQNRGMKSSPYSSQRKTNPNSYNMDSPFQSNQIFQTGKNLQNLIDNKFGKIKDNNNSIEHKRINSNLISPIQTFRID